MREIWEDLKKINSTPDDITEQGNFKWKDWELFIIVNFIPKKFTILSRKFPRKRGKNYLSQTTLEKVN